jgi:type II secretory pathway component PulK
MATRDRQSVNWSHANSRRGAVLIVAMVCLLISSLILGVLLHIGMLHYRQQRAEQERTQAAWLAESAIERAADRLAADRNYAGEAWQLSSTEIGGAFEGKVQITVAAEADNRVITVAALYPSNSSPFAKVSKQVTLRVKSQP